MPSPCEPCTCAGSSWLRLGNLSGTYRAELVADMTEEIRDALVVRAVYLRRFVMVTPG